MRTQFYRRIWFKESVRVGTWRGMPLWSICPFIGDGYHTVPSVSLAASKLQQIRKDA